MVLVARTVAEQTGASKPRGKGDADDVASTAYGDSSAESTRVQAPQLRKEVAVARCSVAVTHSDFETELAMRIFALLQSFEHCPKVLLDSGLITDMRCKNGALLLLTRCFRLLSVAGYSAASIEVTAVHAASYLASLTAALKEEGAELPVKECSYTLCVLMFLAHSHIEDVTLPLSRWQKHLFAHYCSLATLNSAVMSLFEKLDYKLRLDHEQLGKHRATLW